MRTERKEEKQETEKKREKNKVAKECRKKQAKDQEEGGKKEVYPIQGECAI